MANKKTQLDQVIELMIENNGYATLGFLNQNIDTSKWNSKTPFASIRRIVQNTDVFLKIKPGLYALKSYKKLPEYIYEISKQKANNNQSSHTYYQGLLLEIGLWKSYKTFVPNQDKNKLFLGKSLEALKNLNEIYNFGYPDFVKQAKTIDVSWFNHRKMPHAFFEIEHSTPMDRSLIKFNELSDFNAYFFIVADALRKKEYEQKIALDIFKNIRKRTKFYDYESLSEWHTGESKSFLSSPFKL